MQDGNAKQQIADRIKNVTNILVTVSTNPSVDELSAALGLTLMLNKLDKHATAVFSGQVPPAIEFLDPTKTFENTVDSLRDFIIALDKEKADRLRYKVEDDVVRIFITPYKTRISEEDLTFTHGDFNVELVLALGVENQEVLDKAISAHGKILHDATVATINPQNKQSDLGSIGWQDNNASSLCEMLVALGESLQAGLLDEQIATALLTGIVAATNRFSNDHTSPKSMTMAAQLMAAGANQQLIAAKLEEGAEISTEGDDTSDSDAANQSDQDDQEKSPDDSNEPNPETSEKIAPDQKKPKKAKKSDGSLGELRVPHRKEDKNFIPQRLHEEVLHDETPKPPLIESATIEEHDARNKKVAGEEALDAALAKLGASPSVDTNQLAAELQATAAEEMPESTAELPSKISEVKTSGSWRDQELSGQAPAGEVGIATNETQGQVQRDEERDRNKTVLSHDAAALPPLPVFGAAPEDAVPAAPTPVTAPADTHPPTMADIEAEVKNMAPDQPAPVPAPPSSPEAASTLPEIAYEATPLPPLPDFSSLPPLPSASVEQDPPPPLGPDGLPLPGAVPATTMDQPEVNPNDPGQFKIPGQ